MSYRNRGQDFQGAYDRTKWRFKGHAEIPFWKWVSSWARALRKPSDLGFSDDKFILPDLIQREHVVAARTLADGMLFNLTAKGLKEQREERRRTITERCEKVAELVESHPMSVAWCHLNDEGDLLEKIIPGAVQISGSGSDDVKEERFNAFAAGEITRLVIKPRIGGFGLNWQHCAHTTIFPSHSFESYYQSIRRFWRFGQKSNVVVDVVSTEGERAVLKNMLRKSAAANKMFSSLMEHMQEAVSIDRQSANFTKQEELPAWL